MTTILTITKVGVLIDFNNLTITFDNFSRGATMLTISFTKFWQGC